MEPFLLKAVAIIGCCFFRPAIFAQLTAPAMTVDGKLISASKTQEQEPIFQGAEYRRFPYETVNGIIYFGSNSLLSGDVTYHDRQYKNVPLLYDQLTDELITPDMSGTALIRLFTPKVQSFRIHGASFVYLPDSANAASGGFWQVLIDSKSKLLKKESKTLEDRIIDHKMRPVVRVRTSYRLFLRNNDYNIREKDAVIQAFSDQKEVIRAFIKKNRRRFRKAGFESMIIETTRYYNEMSAAK
jgi:hypothetical protein